MVNEELRTDDGDDDSRRSFIKKGALAGSALALGGTAIGAAQQEETPTEIGPDNETETETEPEPTDDGDGDQVLMLLPDAVPNAGFTVESAEVDWNPLSEDDDGEDPTGTETETAPVGNETEGETPVVDGNDSHAVHVVSYDFSASHFAHVFVPDGVSVEQGQEYQLGAVQEVVTDPTGAGEDGDGLLNGEEDQPVFVRIDLSDGGGLL